MNDYVMLTVRGVRALRDLDAARNLHNETAGSEEGKKACRALGDLSHLVYVALSGALPRSDAGPDELLFIDVWRDAEGIQQFFGDPRVQEQGDRLFSERDANVWMRARGAYTLSLHAPVEKNDRFVGILRGRVKHAEAAIRALSDLSSKNVSALRAAGLVSHELYVKLEPPASDGTAELLAIDTWCDRAGMMETYSREPSGIGELYSGRPSASCWQSAGRGWSEW